MVLLYVAVLKPELCMEMSDVITTVGEQHVELVVRLKSSPYIPPVTVGTWTSMQPLGHLCNHLKVLLGSHLGHNIGTSVIIYPKGHPLAY